MSTFDLIFVGAVLAAFLLLAGVLAWGAHRTAGLEGKKAELAE